MKKFSFSILILFVFTHYAICQNGFGVKAGLNLSDQHVKFTPPPDETDQPKNYLGYQLGAFYKIKMSKRWSFSSELNFSVIGSKMLFTTEGDLDSAGLIGKYYNHKMGYLELPLSLQYNMHDFYVGGGLSVSYKLFSKLESLGKTPFYQKADAAANVLAGYKLCKQIDVNIRYSYGLLNILKDESVYGIYSNVTTKNRFFNLSVLYFIK